METAPEKDHRDGTAAAGSTCSPTAPHGVLGGTVGEHAPPDARRTGARPAGGAVPAVFFPGLAILSNRAILSS